MGKAVLKKCSTTLEKLEPGAKKVLKNGSERPPRLSREEIAKAMKDVAASRNRIHVIAYDGCWAVLRAGARRLSKIHTEKRRAVDYAKRLAKKDGAYIVIHKEDGKPQQYIHTQ